MCSDLTIYFYKKGKPATEHLKALYSDDILYHYTKASTAIDYILYNQTIKLFSRSSACDPIESLSIHSLSEVGTGFAPASKMNDDLWDKYNGEASTLKDLLDNTAKWVRQVSFCINSIRAFGIRDVERQIEEFGLAKPRMWDQYGDHYKGVCLAFSKKAIEQQIDDDYKAAKIHYDTYCNIRKMKNIRINPLQFDNSKYINSINESFRTSFFLKHQDYSGENEYKICSFKPDSKDELCVKNCLKAIIISSDINDKQKECLLSYAEKYKVPLLRIDWVSDRINVICDYDCKQILTLEK